MSNPIIDIKSAIEIAEENFEMMFPKHKGTFRLEQVEFDDTKLIWEIVLSFKDKAILKEEEILEPEETFPSLSEYHSVAPKERNRRIKKYYSDGRVNKSIIINAKNGKFVSLR